MPIARTSQMELLDTSVATARTDTLRGNLRDIRRANRFLGGTRAVLNAITPHLSLLGQQERPVRILDVATGSADIPVAIAKLSERRGWAVRITATDLQPDILAIAADARAHDIALEQADAVNLPYDDDTFEISVLSLALHHFEPDDGVRVLSEMQRVSQGVMIVNDFERCRMGLAGAWLFAHATTTNRMTRHDAPLSVRRAYTLPEAAAMARAAGWAGVAIHRVVPFRYVLTGTP